MSILIFKVDDEQTAIWARTLHYNMLILQNKIYTGYSFLSFEFYFLSNLICPEPLPLGPENNTFAVLLHV